MPIVTLIAAERLDAGTLSTAADAIRATGGEPAARIWLDEGKAADISFVGEIAATRAALRSLAATNDIIVQGDGLRRKPMLISDMDSTMITVECIDELADYAGLKNEIAAVTTRAMQGEIDFEAALRGRVALLEGLSVDAIAACLADRVRPMAGARTLVATMRALGAHTVLVSGGFTHFSGPVAAMIGFDEAHANMLGISDGRLNGTVTEPIVDAARKRALLIEIAARLRIAHVDVMAVGDGANDIPMLEAAGLGIAYHAKETTRFAADAAIRHNDLTALLYAQGIPPGEWVAGD